MHGRDRVEHAASAFSASPRALSVRLYDPGRRGRTLKVLISYGLISKEKELFPSASS